MISEQEISSQQQKKNRTFYKAFSFSNAIGYNMQGENIIILFSLALGAPTYIAALLSSFIQIGMVGMLPGRYMIQRHGAAGTLAISWIIRAFFGFLMASSAFIAHINSFWSIFILGAGAFGFFFFRASGISAIQPLYGEITNQNNRGRFTSTIFLQYNIGALLIFCLISFILKNCRGISTYQFLISAGSVSAIIGALFVSRIIESPLPKISADQCLRAAARNVFAVKRLRYLFFSYAIISSMLALSSPVSLICLKKIYPVSDAQAIIYIIVQFAGGIAISLFSRVFSSHTGPRPLLILYYLLIPLVCVLWLFAPLELNALYCGVIFYINGCSSMGGWLALNHYSVNAVPSKERVVTGLMLMLGSGISAGISGAVISSGLLKLLPYAGLSDFNVFRAYFAIVLILAVLGLLVVFRLEKIKDWDLKQVFNLFLTPRDLRTVMILNSIGDEEVSAENESSNIDKLQATHSSLSEKALLESLDSPVMDMRVKALIALNDIDFGEESKRRILHELEHGIYSTAAAAAMIVGHRGITEALPLLRRHLDSDDLYLKSRCIQALGCLGNKNDLERIKDIFEESDNPRIIIYSALALAMSHDPAMLTVILRKSLKLEGSVGTEVLVAAAKMIDMQHQFYLLAGKYNTRGEELNLHLTDYLEAINPQIPGAKYKKIIAHLRRNDNEGGKCFIALLQKAFASYSIGAGRSLASFLAETEYEEMSLLLKCLLLGAAYKFELENAS